MLIALVIVMFIMNLLCMLAMIGAVSKVDRTVRRLSAPPTVRCPRCMFPMKEGETHSLVGCEVMVNGKPVAIDEVHIC